MRRLQFFALVLACAAAACSSDTPTTPTTTTTVTVTDTFAGSLNRNGGSSYSFVTGASGNIQASLSTLTPDAALIVGLSLGTWNGSSCQVVIANDKAVQGTIIYGSASGAGTLCVRIYDTGNIVVPSTYQIQVTHP